jgi:hypothetical protein
MQVMRVDDDPKKTQAAWLNKTTGELVWVVGFQCPDGCREMDREEGDRLCMHTLRNTQS